MQPPPAIEVRNARTHNLKGIDCRIPHGRVTVVTGPSGAGKSSLAFDTVFAEGQRRFVESMSTYARQFLHQAERPPVDEIRNVLPAVALEANNSVKNARSTVGTITEVFDVFRLLFSHLGDVQCPNGHGTVLAYGVDEVAAAAAEGRWGERVLVVAPVPRPPKAASTALGELVRQGYARRLDGGEVIRMTSRSRWPKAADPLLLVLGRFRAARADSRLAAAIEDAYGITGGRVELHGEERIGYYASSLGCTTCGALVAPPVPALFSFNSPLGACKECQGFGRVIGVDRGRVIPDPGLSLAKNPIAPWNTPAYEDHYDRMIEAAAARGVPLDVPWRELPAEVREWVWSGAGEFTNLDRFFKWLERRSYKVHVRALLARYRAYDPCPECDGTRLQPAARNVLLAGRTLPELAALSIENLRRFLTEQRWSPKQRERAGHLFEELDERVGVLERVGLGYLTLDRQARTLSGGEAQRIHLASALGSGLTSTLYVLDEPTIGLHPRDSGRLLELLRDLARRGNTVLVVEHDRTLIRGADHIIDLGPAAGERGGEVLAEGPLATLLATERSLTGSFLRQRPRTDARRHVARYRRERGRASVADEIAERPRVTIREASAHNLRGFDVSWPLTAMVAVTGVSGSGKSTLVENVLWANYRRAQGTVDVDPGACGGLEGLDRVADVVLVDQRPLGRSSRSNAVTYVKAYDEVRKLFAAEPRARLHGITPGHFSFNLDRGRCPECQGTGEVEVDMQFMAAVRITCDRCQGRRFRRDVLSVLHRGLDIAATLKLTVDEAMEHFAESRRLVKKLGSLAAAGLGYLRLGQATSTLSGGEAQRLKLASFLGDRAAREPRLFLFDEPTTGLHMADIDLLYRTLRSLVERGHGVVVVEHSMDLVARADWIVDLGPGGGLHGGELIYSGPLETYLDEIESATADELRDHLRWRRKARAAAG